MHTSYDIRVLIGPERLALKWIAGYVAPPDHLEDMKDWSSSEICAFLDRLLATGVLSASLLSAMDKVPVGLLTAYTCQGKQIMKKQIMKPGIPFCLSSLSQAYHFSDSKNCEIKFRWLVSLELYRGYIVSLQF